jgi:hypothetical protein
MIREHATGIRSTLEFHLNFISAVRRRAAPDGMVLHCGLRNIP